MPAAEATRFLPCLLDRLTDLEPERREEPPASRAATLAQVRAAVLRDLERLLNCHHRLDDDERLARADLAGSVLDYGVPDVCGRSLSDREIEDLGMAIRASIVAFEPRLEPASVLVRIAPDAGRHGKAFAVEIGGRLRVAELREELLFRTWLDPESGRYGQEG